MRKENVPPIDIEGFPVLELTLEQSLCRALDGAKQGLVKVGWLNAHCVNLMRANPEYAAACRKFDLMLNDGFGLTLAARFQGRAFPENLNGTDWIPALLDRLNSSQTAPRRVFLLGATPESLARAGAEIAQRWPHLDLVGSHDGFYKEASSPLKMIEALRPEVLLVGMGVPRQEIFIAAHDQTLRDAGVRIAIAGGAILDFIGHTVARAPTVVQRIKLEWAWRLALEPRRLWQRYLLGNPYFLYHALRHARSVRD